MAMELEILDLYYMQKRSEMGQTTPIDPKYDPLWWLCLLACPKVKDKSGCFILKEEILREFREACFNIHINIQPLATRDEFLYDAWANKTYEWDDRASWYLRYVMMVYHFYHNLYPKCPPQFYFEDEIRTLLKQNKNILKQENRSDADL